MTDKLPSPGQLRFWRDMIPGWSSVGELAEAKGLAQSTTSQHLAALVAAGFVERKTGQDGLTAWHRPVEQVCINRDSANKPRGA
jgi:DNA-binding transcriptional ArsR family regulator